MRFAGILCTRWLPSLCDAAQQATALTFHFKSSCPFAKDFLTITTTNLTMGSLITAIINCVRGTADDDQSYPPLAHDQHARPLDEIANDVVDTILRAEKAGAGLKAELDSMVGPYGWKECLAEKVLEKLGAALQGAHDKLGPAIRDAYNKAWDVANKIEGFIIQHPVMCSIIALGVLVIIAPWIIEALGFAELGPVEGMYTERSKPERHAKLTTLN